jgi:O-antigen/teichoic acid export membrane protein
MLAQLLRWASTFIVIRVLMPEDFAIVSLATVLLGFLEFFTTFGLGTAIIQAKSLTRKQLEVIFGFITLINFFLFTLTWIGSKFVADFYNIEELDMVLKVFSFNYLIIMFSSIPSSILMKKMYFKPLATIDVIASIVGAITSLYLAINNYNYWAIVFGGMSINITKMIMLNLYRPLLLKPRFSYKEAKPFLNFGGFVMISGILWYIYISMDILIAGKFLSREELGVYSVALQLAVLPLNKILPTLKQVAMPAYSKVQTDKKTVKRYVLKSLSLAMFFTFPVFFGLASVAELLIPLVIGDKWNMAVVPFMLLCFIMPLRMLLELYIPAVNSIGKPHIVFKNELFILLFLVPTFLIGIEWGTTGLAFSWVAVFPIISIIVSINYCKVLKIKLSRITKIIFTPFIFSIIMFISVKLTIIFFSKLINGWFLLTAAITIGAGVYILFIYIDDKRLLQEYRNILFKK